MYSSTLSTSKLYEKAINIDPKYSSTSRHNNRLKNIRVVIKNQSLTKVLTKVNLKSITPQPALQKPRTRRQLNPESRVASTSRSLKQFRSTLEKNLQAQLIGVNRLRESSKLHERELKERRAAETRMRTRQTQKLEQQIQFKRKEREREIQVKLRRKTSEKEFILNSHRESVDMMRKSRQVRSRSQAKLLKDQHIETEKDHDFLELKIRATKLRQNFEYIYKKAFVKNQPLPKGVYPNLTTTLAIASKTMTSSPLKNTKKLPKIEKSPTKAAKISKDLVTTKTKHNRKKTQNSEVNINLELQTAKKEQHQIVVEPKIDPLPKEAPIIEKQEELALENPPVLQNKQTIQEEKDEREKAVEIVM